MEGVQDSTDTVHGGKDVVIKEEPQDDTIITSEHGDMVPDVEQSRPAGTQASTMSLEDCYSDGEDFGWYFPS